jgi:hypothetical protein
MSKKLVVIFDSGLKDVETINRYYTTQPMSFMYILKLIKANVRKVCNIANYDNLDVTLVIQNNDFVHLNLPIITFKNNTKERKTILFIWVGDATYMDGFLQKSELRYNILTMRKKD